MHVSKIQGLFLILGLVLSSLVGCSLQELSNQELKSGYQPADNGDAVGAEQDVDSGFQPQEHGFSFPNYTNQGGVVNLTPVEMQRMFGEQVCANTAGGECTLTPPAREWMEQMNQAMNGGHCEGMAVLSELMFYGEIDTEKFGAGLPHSLVLEGNQALQREIAYWWTTQSTFPGSIDKVNQTPSAVVETLQETFNQGNEIEEAWAVGIYQPDMSGGHSITPIAVDDQGGGIFHILVYDNNFPGEVRAIIVDTNQETWEYNGSTNPAESTSLYQGDQSTRTLEIVAISPRLEQQECSFCQDGNQSWFKGSAVEAAGSEQEYFEIWLEGDASLLIVDHAGNKLGFEAGEFIDQIEGASVYWIKLGIDSEKFAPIYRIPQGPAFEFFVDGTQLEEATQSRLSVIALGYFIAIDGIELQPGAVDQVSMWLREDGRGQVIYRPESLTTPIVMAGYETPGADFVYRVRANYLRDDEEELDVRIDPENGEFILNTAFNYADSVYDISVQRYDEGGTETFYLAALKVPPNAEVHIRYGDFEGQDEGFYAFADFGIDGTVDKTYKILFDTDPFEWGE